ncbi:MAG TPA: GNAT family N-acetyltransferase [Actinomycetota bacterium]|nr:GNAT family N-acetyltransferase [Actinomycetota bacterium]
MDAAEELVPEWDRLAVSCSLPFCSPDWMLAWWHAAAPPGARLLVTLHEEGGRVVGLGPFFVTTGRVPRARLLASPASLRGAPLAAPGFEGRVAAELAAVFERQGIPLVRLDGIATAPDWATLLADGSGMSVQRGWDSPAPLVRLKGSTFEEWFDSRSANFRQQMRRDRRKLDEQEATFRLSTEATLEKDMASFTRLHSARWDPRGGSATMSPSIEEMILSAARLLVPQDRLRLWNVDIGGETISSHIFLVAGGTVSYWLGGFDDRWSSMRPSIQTLLAALEHAWGSGDEIFDLGPGEAAYKSRFTDEKTTVEWVDVIDSGNRAAGLILRREQLRRAVSARIPPALRERIRSLVGR